MTLPAWIYARFSSLEQSKGTSLARQLEAGRAFAVRMGWEWSAEREIIDEGKSAFAGDNRAAGGALHEFERKAGLGHFRNGAVLVVEHLDRISRQGYEEAIDFLKFLTKSGVTVATIDGDRIYPAGERIDMGRVMEIIIKAELARDESEKKSRRQLAMWAKKLERARDGDRRAITKLLPAWIEVEPATRDMRLNEHRAAVVREIFELTEKGYGTPAIAKILNARGEPVWGSGKKRSKDGWQIGYLHKILTNRAVLGEYAPMLRARSASLAESKGYIIPDYYPQAIATDLFERVQSERAKRKGTGGKWAVTQANLFSGLAKCAKCRGSMHFQTSARKGRLITAPNGSGKVVTFIVKTQISYLQCDNARRHHICDNRARIRYEYIEQTILDEVLSLAIDNTSFVKADRVAELNVAAAEARRLLAEKKNRLTNLVDSFSRTGSRAIETLMLTLEQEVEADERGLKNIQAELERERGQASPEEHLRRVQDVRASLNSDDANVRYEARMKVKQALAGLISQIDCAPNKEVTAILDGGRIAIKIDKDGKVIDKLDLTNRLDLRRGLERGVLTGNKVVMDAVDRRRRRIASATT